MLERIIKVCWYTSVTVTNALDRFDKNLWAEGASHDRNTHFQPESVKEGHPDRIEEQRFFVLHRLAHDSRINGTITVRGGEMKFALVAGHDTTLHGVQTDTACFQSHSPDQFVFPHSLADANSA